MAGKLDPDNFGEKQGPQVNISIGDLHLQALKHVQAEVINE
jgi:hypothetical protein